MDLGVSPRAVRCASVFSRFRFGAATLAFILKRFLWDCLSAPRSALRLVWRGGDMFKGKIVP